MSAYYNENDPFAAAWLKELIKAGHIAPGDVDERSIEDVFPNDIKEYKQCHFFAGIGTWSHALRRAGWSDNRRIWTGSCPCQPFSTAGKRGGIADERHLWPSWFHLIEQCKPDVVFGEQVEAAIRQGWLDLVQTDLEGINYSFGAVGIPAAGFGAPHIRARLYFVANPESSDRRLSIRGRRSHQDSVEFSGGGKTSILANASDVRCDERRNSETTEIQGDSTERSGQYSESGQDGKLSGRSEGLCGVSELGNPLHTGLQGHGEFGRQSVPSIRQGGGERYGSETSFWSNCEWIPCRDGKSRPVESGTFPLAHGSANRVGRLRGYGNSLVAPVAQAFIEAYIETCTENG